ncbi:MAG TPA: histidine phosphatase family protein [Euzebyales bacterium]
MSRPSAMVYLVRHAHASDKATWHDVDLHRPLSPQGEREAAGLVIRLDDLPIDRVLSSPALRCEQTVRPVAQRRRLAIEHSGMLGVGADAAKIAAFIGDAADRAVLCTHGEVLADLFPILLAGGLVVAEPLVWPKGATWILHRTGTGPFRARFLPPLAWPTAWGLAEDDLGLVAGPRSASLRRRRRQTAGRAARDRRGDRDVRHAGGR